MATAYPGGLRKRGGLLDEFMAPDYSYLARRAELTPKQREYAANAPIDFLRGTFAGLLGTPADVANIPQSPMPMEQFGEYSYAPAQKIPYGSEYFLKNLPLAPAEDNPLGRVAGQVGSFAPMVPVQAARMAGKGVAATGRFVAPKAGLLAEEYMQGMGMMPGIVQKAPSMGSVDVAAYQGSHKAPNAAVYGGTLDDLSKIMPADVYSSQGIRLYGLNDPKVDAEWFKAAYQAKNNPEKLVNVYRAVPKGIKGINSGDWVTTSPTYAKMHGENALGGDYEILSSKVPAKTLSSEGYPYEFGYNAPNQEELKRLQAGGLLAP
jgi:hypothetical protein